MLNVFINTWGNYNENGADGGEWVRLPMDADELETKLEEIAEAMNDSDPEFCIHDYEWLTEIELRDISEMESITDLNEELNEYSDLDEWDQKEVAAAMEASAMISPRHTRNNNEVILHSMQIWISRK